MPRAGLTADAVVAAGAELADEAGFAAVTLARLADRLGIKPPSLYKHVTGLADLRHRMAVLAMTELGDALREALQGRAGVDALDAMFATVRDYVERHPGRYGATIGAAYQGEGDPLLLASRRVIDSIRAVLSGYGVAPDELDHAVRILRCTIHGYATLQASDGFQWTNDPEQSFGWMIRFADAGLHAMGDRRR